MASTSNWRRVDWLVLAQHNFFPRLWHLKENTPYLNELMELFDYRHWKARFDKLKESNNKAAEDLPLIDDLLGIETPKSKAKKEERKDTNLKRRRREKNWDHLRTQDVTSKKSFSQTTASTYRETNKYRITQGDYDTLKELILCMQRREEYEMSCETMELFGKKAQPQIFSKMKVRS